MDNLFDPQIASALHFLEDFFPEGFFNTFKSRMALGYRRRPLEGGQCVLKRKQDWSWS